MGEHTYKRGDTFKLDTVLRGANGAVLDLTGAKVWFTAKQAYARFDTDAVQFANTADGSGAVTVTDAVNGKVTCKIPPEKTVGFPDADVKLFYDVQVKDAAGDVYTAEEGTIVVTPDITRATQ
jgi:hypothetical protein